MAQRPRGTRDFDPAQTAVRRAVSERLRAVFRRFGYREVQTPTFEELELFTAKSGDGIVSELYDFEDKGDRRMCLRPELTAPVMRMYFADHQFDPKPVKWFYFGNCFRYDRPQKGRYREFWQFGCEQIGAGTPLAYAELIALADGLLKEVGLKGRVLGVGHVGVLGKLVDALGLDDDARGQAMRLIDKRDDAALKALLAVAGSDDTAAARFMGALNAATVEDAQRVAGDGPEMAELAEVFRHLESFGVEARVNLGIARGLDYYSGVVFEIHADALGGQSQLLGGGGYDLSSVFDAQATPTMGFGLGFDRTLVALEAEGADMLTPRGSDVYLGALGEAALAHLVPIATALRDQGARVELDLLGRKPHQIAKAADSAGAKWLVIVGDRDIKAGKTQVKDLASGDSREVPLHALVDFVLENTGGLMDLRDYD